jgi:hypothetical protein
MAVSLGFLGGFRGLYGLVSVHIARPALSKPGTQTRSGSGHGRPAAKRGQRLVPRFRRGWTPPHWPDPGVPVSRVVRGGWQIAPAALVMLPVSLPSGCRGRRVLAQVADEAHHVLGDEPPDGAAGVHADHDVALGVEHEAGGLQVHRVGVDEGAGERGDGFRVRRRPRGRRPGCARLSAPGRLVRRHAAERCSTGTRRVRWCDSGLCHHVQAKVEGGA